MKTLTISLFLLSNLSFALTQKINCKSDNGYTLNLNLKASSIEEHLYSQDASRGSVTIRGKKKNIIGRKNILISVDASDKMTSLTNNVASEANELYKKIYDIPLTIEIPSEVINTNNTNFKINLDITPNPDVKGGDKADGFSGEMNCESKII